MATPRAPKGPQPALGGSDAAFKPFTDAAAASSSKSATAVDISDTKQTKEAAAVKQAVLKAISLQLKDTYRKTNPSRPVGCDVAPRRVLTHPSIPVANGCARPISRQTCMPVCWPLAAQRARVYSPRAASSLPPPPCRPPQNLGRSTHGTRACCSPQLRFVNAWHPSARLLPPILRPPFDFDPLSLSQRRRQRARRLNRRRLRHDRHAKRRAPRDFGPLGPRHLWAGPQGAHAGRFRLRVEGDPESAGLPTAGGDGGRAGTLAHRIRMLLR